MNVLKNCRHGLMVYNTNDIYIGRSLNEYGEFCQLEIELFDKVIEPGMIVLDVGANIGSHTVFFSKKTGREGLVFAYEPQRMTYYTLCTNIILNNLTNVYCMQNAVGKDDKRVEVPELDTRLQNNFGGVSLVKPTDECNKFSVKCIRIDDKPFARVDFIKIDVEGMEGEVISGARETILKHRPFLYVENDRNENATSLIKLIKSLDYEIYFHNPPLYNVNNFLSNYKNVFGNISSINMLCCPKEKKLEFNTDELKLIQLKDKSEFVVQKNNTFDCLDVDVDEPIIESCINASCYYSENFFNHTKAMAYADIAMKIKNDDWRGFHQSAIIMFRVCNYDAALKFVDLSIERNPLDFDNLMLRATILGGLNRYTEAIEQYQKIIKFYPLSPEPHFYLGCTLNTLEKYKEGFKECEWRFELDKIKQFMNLFPNLPMWKGENLTNKKILLFCEQGKGDLIQFIRYAELLEGEVHLACPKDMVEVLKNCKGIKEIIPLNPNDVTLISNKFDFICSVASLPNLLGIHQSENYIVPSNDEKIPCDLDKNYLNVGIVWAGSDTHENDYIRSCHLKHFETLQEVEGVKLYSLQKGKMTRRWVTDGEVNLLKESENIELENYSFYFNNFNDTANFINNLDLVISVDTCVAHLAASMGKPTWLLTGIYPDHRWLTTGNSTVWYPKMKIFRKSNKTNSIFEDPRDWNSLFAQVKEELVKLRKSWNLA